MLNSKVQEEATENFQKIMNGGGGKFLSGEFQSQCFAVTQSTQRSKKKYEKLVEIATEASAYVAPHAACGRGCHHCCHMTVTITGYEAQLIGKHIGISPTPVPHGKELLSKNHEEIMKELRDKYMGKDCPFLKEGLCTIYEVRPLACRAYFNISNDRTICDLTAGLQDVPSVDMGALWAAQAYSFMNYEFGDIREFMPDVSKWVNSLTN